MTGKKLAAVGALAAGVIVSGAIIGGSGLASGATAPPTGCPAGNGPIQVADLTPPARLMIQQQGSTPSVVTPSTSSVQLHFLVSACNGRPVQGANLFAVSIPYNEFTAEHGTTAADGTLTLTASELSGFPASRRQELLAVLVRATKAGEPILGGVSSRRVVSFPVSLG